MIEKVVQAALPGSPGPLAPLLLVSALAFSASPASAQDQARDERPAIPPGIAAPGPRAGGDVEIVVTGSHIRHGAVLASEPIATVPSSRVLERNDSHFFETLNGLPGIRGSVTPEGAQTQFGQGVYFANTFSLGSNRTLTLVNGKRVVSSNAPTIFSAAGPGTQVDLNAIPSILLERVERLSIGGSPAYGSDAIAATINVIVNRELTGLKVRALSGVSNAADNFRWKLAAAGGQDFASGRGNVTFAGSIDHVSGVSSSARAAFRANVGAAPNPCTVYQPGLCTPFGTVAMLGPAGRTPESDGRLNPNIGFNDSASDGYPASVLIRGFSLAAVTPGGVLSNGPGAYGLRFAPDGTLVPYNRGTLFSAPLSGPLAAAAIASGGDGLTLFDRVALTTQMERINAAAFVTYELTDRLTFKADALYYHGKADEPVDLPTFNAVQFRGDSGALTFRTDNPLLSAQARQQLAALGYGETFQLSRANTDLADRSGSSRSELYRFVAALEGKLAIGGRDYDFEISANYGQSRLTDFGQAIDQQRFINAVNVALVGGVPACTTTPTVGGFAAGAAPVADPACVPLNLFGEGALSQGALDYVLRDTRARSRIEQFVTSANLSGSPFDLFGNPAAFSLGYEHREESARFMPDAFLQAGSGRSVGIAPVAGSYDLDEVFGEVLLPLIMPENKAPISKAVVFARARRVDNSANGAFTAWTAGGAIAPIRDVELHGNFTRSFRSPAILELYSPRVTGNVSVPDLCSAANINAGPVPDIRSANCSAFLARYPAATPLLAATATVPALTGGNPNLRNEKADSYTFGATIQPRFVPGLTITADYLDIRISDPIESLTVGEIAQGCFDNPSFDAGDPAHGNALCSLIARDASGQVVSDAQAPAVTTGYVNGKRIRFSGEQATIDYRTALEPLGMSGTLAMGADLFHVRRRIVDVTGVAPARSDGLLNDPHWQAQLRLRYANRTWGLLAHVNYAGKQAIALTQRGASPSDTREIDHFNAFATVDTSLFFRIEEKAKLTFSVTNLFNRIGQDYYGYIVPLSINDALGRRFAISFDVAL